MAVLLITGTRTGLGQQIARIYLRRGQTVVGCSRRAATMRHRRYAHRCLDLRDEAAVVRVVREVSTTIGPIGALINNAGVAGLNHLVTTPGEAVQRMFDTNVLGSFLMLREVAKGMIRARHGRIVNLTSIAAPLHLAGEAVYAASKAAIESLTVTAAKELGPYGITVNAVGPTVFPTALTRTVPRDKLSALRATQAIPRDGTLTDLTNAIDFFLSPRSSFITGQVLYLGGIHG